MYKLTVMTTVVTNMSRIAFRKAHTAEVLGVRCFLVNEPLLKF